MRNIDYILLVDYIFGDLDEFDSNRAERLLDKDIDALEFTESVMSIAFKYNWRREKILAFLEESEVTAISVIDQYKSQL